MQWLFGYMSPTTVSDGIGNRTLSPENVHIQARYGGAVQGVDEPRKPGALDESRRKELEARWKIEEDALAKEEIENGLLVNAGKRVATLHERLENINAVHEAQIVAIDRAIAQVTERINNSGDNVREADRNILEYFIQQKDDLELRHAQDVAFVVLTASKNYPQPVMDRSFPAPSTSGVHHHSRSNCRTSWLDSQSSYSVQRSVQSSTSTTFGRRHLNTNDAAVQSSYRRAQEVLPTSPDIASPLGGILPQESHDPATQSAPAFDGAPPVALPTLMDPLIQESFGSVRKNSDDIGRNCVSTTVPMIRPPPPAIQRMDNK